MAIETLRDEFVTPSGQHITHSDVDEARAFIDVDHKGGVVSFVLQNGPIKEAGINGCQVTDMIEVAKMIIEAFNEKFPCRENSLTITKLDEALMWQKQRTAMREARGVEGYSKA